MIIKNAKLLVKEYPSHTVFSSLIITILIGTCILALPACHTTSIRLIDLLFIATSLTTSTGLASIPLDSFTGVGHTVLLILMQIGGLGLMTMSLLVMSLFVDLGLYTQVLAGEILSIQSFKDSKRILYFIIKLTFFCELIGAIVTFSIIKNDFSFNNAVFLSIFHSVTAFCNDGMSLFKNGTLTYNTNSLMLITTTSLILFGSLGFVTWHEFFKLIKSTNSTNKFSWHTNLVLKTYFITGLVTGILFWILERSNTLMTLTPMQTFLNVLLISVSTKSAGYLPIAVGLAQPATLLLLAVTAFIGSAPSSTGGGIKTSAFAIFLSVVRATIRGRSHAEIHGRRIEKNQVYKAMAIIALACSWILLVTFCLLITEQTYDFLDILLEAISAFSNNGISKGITATLSDIGKSFIIVSMIVGRIGALALIIGMKKTKDSAEFSYPEERVILG